MSYLPLNNMEEAPIIATVNDDINRLETQRLNEIIPNNKEKPYDMKEVIQLTIDDNSNFLKYKKDMLIISL